MANPGVGNKFVSVNLNKSYGQSSSSSHSNHHHYHHSSGGYGSGRARSGGGSGGGGGMVVLSRPRSSHKVGPKLSVPPPLNLPSLRKEHERFDSLGSGSGAAGSGASGSGARPSSSGVGWSKPSAVVVAERDGIGAGDRPLSSDGVDPGLSVTDRVNRVGGGAYMPPSARSGAAPDVSAPVSMDRASVLRGEDFPSLRATLTAVSGTAQKQKDSANQKQRQGLTDEVAGGNREGSRVDMRPQVQSSQNSVGYGGNASNNHNSVSSRPLELGRKQDDYFPGPLPLVRLSPRSDWADDERDISHGLTDRGRDHGFLRTEAYWDRDFDLPRSNFPSHKPAQNHFDRRGQRDDDVGKGFANEVSNADPISRDVRAPSREGREGQSWRTPASKDGVAPQEVVSDRHTLGARPTSVNREMTGDNKYIQPQFGGHIRDGHNGGVTANRDFATGRRDPGYGQGGRQQWNNAADPNYGKGTERNVRDRYGSESSRYKTDTVQNNIGSRPSFFYGNKGLSGNDHMSNFGRDKRSSSRSEKPYEEDPFLNGFDGRDPFTGNILGVVKRKKDANKQLDFHDPVRESFEAELERVQKVQEQERLRIVEEQEKALEMARREEEERQRLAREQEEIQRRLEEEAREAAWRAEQEKMEAFQKAEEQRIAREQEKQRIMMEEERRKQAAKQKLLELEERIARRQAETAKTDNFSAVQGDIMPAAVIERDVSRADDFTGWEDGERMVERITNTASSDSSLSRSFDTGSRPVSVREGSIGLSDRGKSFNSWRRDGFENANSSFFSAEHENGHQSPRRDVASVSGRAYPRKDFYGGAGYMPTRGYYRGGIAEPHMDDFPHLRAPRWNMSTDGDSYGRNPEVDAEFHDNFADRFDLGWGQGRGRGNSPFPDRLYQNPELDELYSYGRSRYPARQPRVLPPPSLPPSHRTSFRDENEHPGSSAYEDGNVQFNTTLRGEPTSVSYQNVEENHADVLEVPDQSAKNGEQERNRSSTPGCDSQSSLSVSSPPSSPTHLSHDDLDESRDSLAVSGTATGHDSFHSENETILSKDKSGKDGALTSSCSISVGDDEEWTVENSEELQQQEEYDEEVGYQEEDEVHEGDENVELNREFEDMNLEEKGSPRVTDNVVLGFDQGVEVGLPNDEYEMSQRIEGSLYAGPQTAIDLVEQEKSYDGSRDGQIPQVADISHHAGNDNASVVVQETEKAVHDYVSEPINASHTSTLSIPVNSLDSASVNKSPAQQSVPSAGGEDSQSSSQQALPSGAGVQGAAEMPVKLQFGLFSGPSLIPSPVPAIQIGSIQMPLQLHPQMGSPLTHMHAPQPPLFQFGQLRYPSPISQGIMPLGPPPMSFVQPNVAPGYPSSQRHGGPLSVHPVQDSSSRNSREDDSVPLTANSHHMQHTSQLNVCQGTEKEANLRVGQRAGNIVLLRQNQADAFSAPVDQVRPESVQQVETMGRSYNASRSAKPLLSSRAPENRTQGGPSSSHSSNNSRDSSGPAQGQHPGSKGRRFTFTARNPGARLTSSANGASHSDGNGFQRRPRRATQRFEFRVRRTADGKQSSALPSSNNSELEVKSISDGRGSATQPKDVLKNLSDIPKQTVDSEISSSDQAITRPGIGKPAGKEASASGHDTSRRAEGSLKRNISPEDDADAPLQSGVVRVFKQPGIEAPSDEDDFIEVRSKRQMLNDRREQREKEIKAKSTNMRKSQRKTRSIPQGTATVTSTGRASASSSAQVAKGSRPSVTVTSKQGLINNEVSAGFNNVVSQTLAPIGTPPTNADSRADASAQTVKSSQPNSYSSSKQTVGSDPTFDIQSKVRDGVHSSVGSWGVSRSNQPVMALTQTQLEEAMKPVQHDKHMVSVGDQANSVNKPARPSSSVLVKDIPFSSATSPISSLLAGEKIQFGAVTSPTILAPCTRVVSHNIRPPASSQLDIQLSRTRPASGSDCALLFEKEKHSNDSCLPLEDCEAEAEAAASAVAVAAIGNDEPVGNGNGGPSASISDPKGFSGGDMNGITTGISGEQHSVSYSKAEETLSVSLPADLSVETPPISLWPPLPSPHSSSSQMVSPFPGGPTSHFPFYDMNSMMGGPVFAFGPHEESAGPQSQPQKSNVSSSGPLGAWQQCHTGVDSFYGPPAGFTAPFISPPGSMPGVQGPPHMVVYNHFAPVGQFGQVGLSYMGTTYIPSGKQPDWKRNPTSSAMGGGAEADLNNLNMARNSPNVPGQVQHLAPGSPLLSMASPMAMFEVSPFQNSPDPSVQPRWPHHVHASSLHSIPQSMPLPQQAEGAVPAQQFNPGSADHHSLTAINFGKPLTSSPHEEGRSFTVGTNTGVTHLPDELGLVEAPTTTSASGSTAVDSVRVDAVIPESSGNKRNPPQVAVASSHRAQSAQQKNSSNTNHYQRGVTHKNGSGAEWSNRKMGFHGRSHSGGERGFHSTKVKQIYVAKQSTGGNSTAV